MKPHPKPSLVAAFADWRCSPLADAVGGRAADLRRARALQPRRVGQPAAEGCHRDPAQGGTQTRARFELRRRGHAAPRRRSARSRAAVAAPVSHPRRRRAHGCATRRSSHSSRNGCAASRYVAIGEFHLYGADAELPVPRRMVALAKQYKLVLHAHSDVGCDRAPVPPGSRRAHPVGAFRLRTAGKRARPAAQAQEPVVRSRVPQRARRRRQGAGGMARGVHRVSGPLHGRHRHLHAGALALHRRARQLVARVARRSACRAGRAHRVAQRRGALRVLEAAPRSANRFAPQRARPTWLQRRHRDCCACCAHCTAQACGGDLVGTRHVVENAHYTIAYRTAPDPIPVGQHFVVEFAVCRARTAPAPPQAVRVDANMPEHKHGMNYRPVVTKVRPGTLSCRRTAVPHARPLGDHLRRRCRQRDRADDATRCALE